MFRIRTSACLVGLASILLSGCQTYRPEPLAPQAIIDDVVRTRSTVAETAHDKPLTFAQVSEWMSEKNPELRRLRDEYARLSALGELKTPLPNPTVDLGLARAFRLSPAGASRTQPFAGLGFTVPLGRKRAVMDDLKAARAEATRTELVARHRELFLHLRAAYLRYGMIVARLKGRDVLAADAKAFREVGVQLARAGIGSGLDVGLAELEIGRLNLQRNLLKQELLSARSELAALSGVSIAAFSALSPEAPGSVSLPSLASLRDLLADNHVELARLTAAYCVAEVALRLEVERQYPDLDIGSGAEQEAGEKTRLFSLGASVELPIFDRNEIGILEAEQGRDAIRSQYASVVSTALAELETALAQEALTSERDAILNEELLPSARRNLAVARKLLKAGNLDAMRYLELSRGERELSLTQLEVQSQRLETALALERIVGAPLIRMYENEAGEAMPVWSHEFSQEEKVTK